MKAAVFLASLVVPASATDWFSNESQSLKLPIWPTSVEKLLLADEPTPEDFEEKLQNTSTALENALPGFTTLENYPSPLINPTACRRFGMGSSFVCDPDHVLSSSELDHLEDRLAHIRRNSIHRCGEEQVPYMFAVAIVQELPFGVDANTFATELIDRWGLGHSGCHDGILMVYAADTGDVTLKWKRGVEPQINFKIYGALLKDFRRNGARLSASRALEADVVVVGQHLTGEILPPRQTPHLVVLLTIASLTALAYCACAATVISDELSKYD